MTSKDGERLDPKELRLFELGTCPDCQTNRLLEGPHGGLSVNVYCGNPACGSRFNDMGPLGVDRISDAQPKQPPPVPGRGPYQRGSWGT